MQTEQLKQTLNSVHEALAAEANVDPELRDLLATLDDDIHHLLDQETAEETSPAMDTAEALAARFAVEHPRVEALIREVVAALAKMGV